MSSSQQSRAEITKIWYRIVAESWHDPSLKSRLLADPAAVFRSYGVEPPTGVELKVVENSPTTFNLVLPTRPARDVVELDSPLRSEEASTFYYIF